MYCGGHWSFSTFSINFAAPHLGFQILQVLVQVQGKCQCGSRVVRHGVSEVTPCSGVFVFTWVSLQMGVVCCGFDVLWVRKSCVLWSVGVCHFVGAKWLCVFACMSAGFCWLFKCGSMRVVKGVWIWKDKKEGKNQPQKGREAEVTSTARKNNARLLCLECLTSLASQEHAYRRRFLFSLMQTVSNRKNLVCLLVDFYYY